MGVRTTGYDQQDNVTSEADERTIATTYVHNAGPKAPGAVSPGAARRATGALSIEINGT